MYALSAFPLFRRPKARRTVLRPDWRYNEELAGTG